MALGDDYLTRVELKTRLGISDAVDDAAVSSAINAISRDVESFCNRQFNDAGVTSTRVYYPENSCLVEVDDFHTTGGLVVETDDGDDGTYETTWASADFQLEPLNGIVGGQPGWPFWEIWAIESRRFPSCSRRAPVRVTAQWGWATVPAPVKEAAFILAAETFKLKDAPFGVAGFGDFGVVRVRDNPMAAKKLAPYVLHPVLVA